MPANQRKKLAPRRKMKPGRFTKQEINKMKKKLGFKKMNLKATTNLGTKIRGRGDYTVSSGPYGFDPNEWQRAKNRSTTLVDTLPWNDTTGSVGMVNRGARAIGNALGGESLGNAASWLSRAFGFGEYTIKSNTLNNSNIAQFKNHGTIEFAHREYIADISSSTGFTNQSFPINPGNSTLFPWLSTIAKNFEQYQMMGLIFEFKSTSATAVGSVNTGLGTVIMATDYDVLDNQYADKRAMEVSEFSTSAPPSVSQVHPVECDPKQNVMRQLFIQPGNSVSAYPDDPRFSALGNFQIATSGMQAVSTIGELWVSYHIKLYKPQLESSSTGATARAHAGLTSAPGGEWTLNYVDYTNPGAIKITKTGAQIQILATTIAGVGQYLVVHGYRSSASGSALTSAGIAVPYPQMIGSASLVPLSYDYLGIKNNEGMDFRTASAFETSVAGGSAQNPTSTSVIVNIRNAGDGVYLPIFYDAGRTVYHDIYITPYTTNFVEQAKISNEKLEIQQLKEEMRLIRESQNKTDAEWTKLKEEFTESDDEDTEEDQQRIKNLLIDEAKEDWEKIQSAIAESENLTISSSSSSTASAPQTVQLVAMHKKDAKKYLDSLKKQTSI